MNKIILVLSMLLTMSVNAKTIVVGVIDTGFNFSFNQYEHFKLSKPKLCKTGHKDFTGSTITDTNGHGSNIVSLIAKGNESADYCVMVLKYYSEETADRSLTLELEAIQYAIEQKVDILNMSLSGYEYSKKECLLIKEALNRGIKIVAAAGNEGYNLAKTKVYPAMCDDRIKVVMNYDKDTIHYTSNYGSNVIKERGTNQYGVSAKALPEFKTGTSQATANYTAKLLKQLGGN